MNDVVHFPAEIVKCFAHFAVCIIFQQKIQLQIMVLLPLAEAAMC
jgi:hypothetical protein